MQHFCCCALHIILSFHAVHHTANGNRANTLMNERPTHPEYNKNRDDRRSKSKVCCRAVNSCCCCCCFSCVSWWWVGHIVALALTSSSPTSYVWCGVVVRCHMVRSRSCVNARTRRAPQTRAKPYPEIVAHLSPQHRAGATAQRHSIHTHSQ